MRKAFSFCLWLSFTSIGLQAIAQTTDSIFVTDNIRPFLYNTLPEGVMLTSTGNKVNYQQFIKDERTFRNKPTLVIAWSNRFCPPCIKLIDSILDKKIQNRYNVVLINKDQSKNEKAPVDDISMVKKISEARPGYTQKAVSLFDNLDILNSIDQGSVPLFLWMDANMNIAGTFLGYGITINQVEDILNKVDNKTITSNAKFLDGRLMPAVVSEAVYKVTMQDLGGVYTFTSTYIPSNKVVYRLNFTKTAAGFFVYHKSSLHVPALEDIYKETEIIDGVKKMLGSLNAQGIANIKGVKENDNWYASKLTIKNFTTSIGDDKETLVISNKSVYPLLDRSRNSKKLEFYHIAKALNKSLAVIPKEKKGEITGYLIYTYNLNKDLQIILQENGANVYLSLVATKNDQGNLPLATTNSDLKSVYNASKLCDAVKRIKTELAKSNKTGILGEKNGTEYISRIQIENFKGKISEDNSSFRYRGYITVDPFENATYTKEFELISTQLQSCLSTEPKKDHSWQCSHTYMLDNSWVLVGMNSKSTLLWIEIMVLK